MASEVVASAQVLLARRQLVLLSLENLEVAKLFLALLSLLQLDV